MSEDRQVGSIAQATRRCPSRQVSLRAQLRRATLAWTWRFASGRAVAAHVVELAELRRRRCDIA